MRAVTMSKDRKLAKTVAVTSPDDDQIVTTVKCRKRVARLIRQLGAHLDINQEDVLDLFAPHVEDYLLNLLAKRLGKIRAGVTT